MRSYYIILLLCFEVGAQPPRDMLDTPSLPIVDVAISAPVVSHIGTHVNAHFDVHTRDGDMVFAYVPLAALSVQLDGTGNEKPCIVGRELSSFCCVGMICDRVFSGSLSDVCDTINAPGALGCSEYFDVDVALGNWTRRMDGLRAVQTTKGLAVSFDLNVSDASFDLIGAVSQNGNGVFYIGALVYTQKIPRISNYLFRVLKIDGAFQVSSLHIDTSGRGDGVMRCDYRSQGDYLCADCVEVMGPSGVVMLPPTSAVFVFPYMGGVSQKVSYVTYDPRYYRRVDLCKWNCSSLYSFDSQSAQCVFNLKGLLNSNTAWSSGSDGVGSGSGDDVSNGTNSGPDLVKNESIEYPFFSVSYTSPPLSPDAIQTLFVVARGALVKHVVPDLDQRLFTLSFWDASDGIGVMVREDGTRVIGSSGASATRRRLLQSDSDGSFLIVSGPVPFSLLELPDPIAFIDDRTQPESEFAKELFSFLRGLSDDGGNFTLQALGVSIELQSVRKEKDPDSFGSSVVGAAFIARGVNVRALVIAPSEDMAIAKSLVVLGTDSSWETLAQATDIELVETFEDRVASSKIDSGPSISRYFFAVALYIMSGGMCILSVVLVCVLEVNK